MLLCGWEHEYEHLDLNGWIPDFAIWGEAGQHGVGGGQGRPSIP